MIHGLLQPGVGVLAILVTGSFVVTMWRRRAEPTARPLLAVATVLFVGALGHLAVGRPTPVSRGLTALAWADAGTPLWLGVLMVVVLLAGGFWFLFTLQYTGRGAQAVTLTAAAVGTVWLLVLGIALLGDISPSAESRVATSVELGLFVGSFLMGVVMVVGALLVVATSLRRNAVRVREGLALSGGGSLVAFAPIASTVLMHPATSPVMFTAASALFILAVRRYPTFEAPPVARIAGRDRLIEELADPFVVVDLDGRVRDLNPAGERYFDTAREAAVDEPLAALLPTALDPAAVAAGEGPEQIQTPEGARLAVTANRITDARDRSFGHLLVFRDVTDRQRRERRLGVLNQLLTGAVSERMQAVGEAAAAVAEAGEAADPPPSAVGREIRTETAGLLELVAWTRDIERTLAEAGDGTVAVGPVVREVAERVATDEGVDLAVTVEDGRSGAALDAAVLETVLEILLADAVERGSDAVSVEVVMTDGEPEVHLVDGGGGPPAPDTTGGADSSRNHDRSELLVGMARLAARQGGGDISVRSSTPGERRVVLELPAAADTIDGSEPATAGTGSVGGTGVGR
jgi:PAS domain-containing protein